jgi:uncharacterized protein
MTGASLRVVPCPRCGRPAVFAATNRWRPFCSERCAAVDLGAWASEAYRVEDKTPSEPEGLQGSPGP